MRLSFSRARRPHTIYVLKSFRDKTGKSTTKRVETLGTAEDIEKKHGCADGLAWARKYVACFVTEWLQYINCMLFSYTHLDVYKRQLLEATTPVKLPAKQCPRFQRVRSQMCEGPYFNNGSPDTGVPGSQPPDYPTHRTPGPNAKLQ